MLSNPSNQPHNTTSHPVSTVNRPALALVDKLSELGGMFNKAPKRVLLAYSGGLDSSVLLHLLHQVHSAGILDLAVAYYDHGWRGAPVPELGILHKQCHSLGLSLILLTGNRNTPKTEANAREVRYTALLKLAKQLQVDAIVTAHHADDQVETILFRLFRGTGVDGLKGIQPRWVPDFADNNGLPVLRPLLAWTRQELYDYATQHQLRWFEDPTNQDTQFSRNAIRQQLLPLLDQHFPTARLSLLRLSQVLGSDADIVAETMERLWHTVYSADTLSLKRRPFNALGEAYQRRLLKRFLDQHAIESTWSQIDKALRFVRGERPVKANTGSRPQLFSLPSAQNQDKNLNRRYLSIYKADTQGAEIQIVTLTKKPVYSPRLLPPIQPEVTLLWPVILPKNLPCPPVAETPPTEVEEALTLAVELELTSVEEENPETEIKVNPNQDSDSPVGNVLTESATEATTPSLISPRRSVFTLDAHAPFLRKTLTLQEFIANPEQPITAPQSLSASVKDNDTETVWVDLTRLENHLNTEGCKQSLVLRTRRPGDRFQPLGMTEPVSLKSFLINRKLPHSERANRLLLVLATKDKNQPDEVLWIPGVEISDWLKVPVTDAGIYEPTHELMLHPMALKDLFENVPAYNVLPLRDSFSAREDQNRFSKRRIEPANFSGLSSDSFNDSLADDFEVERLFAELYPPAPTPIPLEPLIEEEVQTFAAENSLPLDGSASTETECNPLQELEMQPMKNSPSETDAESLLAIQKPLPADKDVLAHLLGL